jgi:hypothetical protein
MRIIIVTFVIIIPLLYVLLVQLGIFDFYWLLEDISSKTQRDGVLLSIWFGIVLFWQLGKMASPNQGGYYMNFDARLGLLGAALMCLRTLIIGGRVSANLEYQGGTALLFFGYAVAPLVMIGWFSFVGSLLRNSLSRTNLFFILLWYINTILIGNRSGLLELLFIYILVELCIIDRIKLGKKAYFYMLIGLLLLPLAYVFRTNSEVLDISSVFQRFYFNSQTLFFAIADQQKIHDILLYNQPRGIIENSFSFLMNRTHISSSYRLPEYWGGVISESKSGHLTGYIYGWLGLMYGLFGRISIFLVPVTIMFFTKLPRQLMKFTMAPLFIYIWARIFFEYFFNLGLDSFAEKCSKIVMYSIIGLLIQMVFNSLFRKKG